MADQDFKVIIVGGGIAGIAAYIQAVALRSKNRTVTVYEQSSQLREIGAGISIVDERWGLQSILGKNSSVDKGFRIYQSDGTLAKEIFMSDFAEWGDRVVYHRKDLHDGLIEAAVDPCRKGQPVTILTSKRVVSCDPEMGIVTFADGTTAAGHLVIAADGIKSRVRANILRRNQTAIPTGFSDYLMNQIPMEKLEAIKEFTEHINPRENFTTMVMCHDRRLVMGPKSLNLPQRDFGLLQLENLSEDASETSWTSQGSLAKFLESFSILPKWLLSAFQGINSLGLWQLRDLDPLDTWYKGRTIMIGDAAHAMLPTQGQGASQAVEDAEALESFFDDIQDFDTSEVNHRLSQVFKSRYKRATLIQKYSRQQAQPATEKDSLKIHMKPEEFAVYNYSYEGAKNWLEKSK
ncbi:hypothetical protein E8E14_011506 [Neopestalotiopsis sp. 37M]|nr:hypothetical protein E8E14_011506 [Neopestalotiopsis sp. 37M]